jgi:hypothetical protein
MIRSISFAKNTVVFNAKYECQCGYKFVRKNSDWFTISGLFNTKSKEEIKSDILAKLKIQKRDCPKCKSTCIPNNH